MIDSPEKVTSLAERFENALHNTAKCWRHAVDRHLKYIGIGLASWMTIATASQVRSPLSQSELADMLAVSRASMVHMIDRLVKVGLVIREPSTSDRRVNHIVITDAGNRLYAELKSEAAAVRQVLLASVDLEKLAHLTELLEQLQSILQPYHHRGPETHDPADELPVSSSRQRTLRMAKLQPHEAKLSVSLSGSISRCDSAEPRDARTHIGADDGCHRET
jgi:MarR family transcriptional regulator for hemolysin